MELIVSRRNEEGDLEYYRLDSIESMLLRNTPEEKAILGDSFAWGYAKQGDGLFVDMAPHQLHSVGKVVSSMLDEADKHMLYPVTYLSAESIGEIVGVREESVVALGHEFLSSLCFTVGAMYCSSQDSTYGLRGQLRQAWVNFDKRRRELQSKVFTSGWRSLGITDAVD